MNAHAGADPEPDPDRPRGREPFPAYGPVDAALGFVVFYLFVERATPTVVDILTSAVTGLSASAVGFGLAAVLWFVFAVTTLDQLRRQLAALGLVSDDGRRTDGARSVRAAPSALRLLSSAVVAVVAGFIAAVTFDRAVDAGIALIRLVADLGLGVFLFGAFPLVEFLVMVVFFVSFGAATRSLDRLVVGSVRAAFRVVPS
ncbi:MULTISPECIES: hypothetical protein [Haloferax]|uniref:Uncharacterized protein n=1 Tax=Haloferax massiliensis TaxID=1476858 RepID=A0A0D6JTM4_9EURY|nr:MULTISPECIES: hypothetical protein [Haloferax]MDS0241643.1 hypothetical protein [Haloferax sp. S2CR25]MDS0444764.1 hypothetical protein [Haloferax sp. S2CR25-2]CQR51696.1 hypothetical protein BN996_02774 [Haloferax massiliensis]